MTLIRILINDEKRKQRIKEKRIAYMGQGRLKTICAKICKECSPFSQYVYLFMNVQPAYIDIVHK